MSLNTPDAFDWRGPSVVVEQNKTDYPNYIKPVDLAPATKNAISIDPDSEQSRDRNQRIKGASK